MSLKKYFKDIKNSYVLRQVQKIELPHFEEGPIVHQRLVFHGRVQKVGFRLEIFELSKKLGLSGWVRNQKDGSVEAQIHGEQNRIRFLIHFMESLKRAKVVTVDIIDLPVENDPIPFHIRTDEIR